MVFIGLTFVTFWLCIFGARAENNDSSVDSNIVDTTNGLRHPKAFYLKAYSFMVHSKPFKNFTLEDAIKWIDNAEAWKAPKELYDRFPYYQSGYDFEDRPVWIMEMAKYNTRREVEKGPEAAANLEKYAFQACLIILESMESRKAIGKDISEIFVIADWEGLDFRQVAHIPTAAFVLTLFRTYVEIIARSMGYSIAINVSYPAEIAFNIGRPFLGGIFEKLDVYGNNKTKWSAELRRFLPEDAIPTKYGGRKGFKPIQYYG